MKCWCGRPLASGRCDQGHDPFALYLCSCGLHLFTTKQSASPAAWIRHQTHIAEFQARTQARCDVAAAGVSAASLVSLAAGLAEEAPEQEPVRPAVVSRPRPLLFCDALQCGAPARLYAHGARCETHRPGRYG